jgi:hypothetical protein
VDKLGWDSVIYTGTGGNNAFFQLVVDGMKFQPCEPNFVESRDGVLDASNALHGSRSPPATSNPTLSPTVSAAPTFTASPSSSPTLTSAPTTTPTSIPVFTLLDCGVRSFRHFRRFAPFTFSQLSLISVAQFRPSFRLRWAYSTFGWTLPLVVPPFLALSVCHRCFLFWLAYVRLSADRIWSAFTNTSFCLIVAYYTVPRR